MSEFDAKRSIELIVDYLFSELDAYEITLYLYLLRKTILLNKTQIRIGKRSLQSGYVRGARGGGKGNIGGVWVDYSHVTRILNGLKSKRCIEIGNTTRDGTLYTIFSPEQIPFVQEALASAIVVNSDQEDYFHDPKKRLEIYERDNWRCQYCGEHVDKTNITIDHYIPQSLGGSNNKDNLKTSCLMCNSIKSGKNFEEVAPQLLKAAVERRIINKN